MRYYISIIEENKIRHYIYIYKEDYFMKEKLNKREEKQSQQGMGK